MDVRCSRCIIFEMTNALSLNLKDTDRVPQCESNFLPFGVNISLYNYTQTTQGTFNFH